MGREGATSPRGGSIQPVQKEALAPIGRSKSKGTAPVGGGIAPVVKPGSIPSRDPVGAPGGSGGVVSPAAGSVSPPPATSTKEGLVAAGVYASSGGGFGASFTYIDDDVVVYGAHPYHYGYAPAPYYAACYGPVYSPYWYGSSWAWGPGWASPCWSPVWYAPYCAYPSYSSGSYFSFGYFGSGWRFSVGFGYSCSPYYVSHCHYPVYRVYRYYPYCYYSTVAYYPAYTAVYHSDAVVVEHAEVADPYVEYVDEVPAGAVPASEPVARAPLAPPPVPDTFARPFVADFPAELSGAEALARGEAWMKSGDYLLAAEAYRRSWLSTPQDAYPALQLGLALFAAGGRVGEACLAITEGLDRQPEWIGRRQDVRSSFQDPKAFEEPLRELQKHVVRNPRDGEARFLLGWMRMGSGDDFAAHTEFSALRDGAFENAHLDALVQETERRLLGGERR